MNIGDVQKRLFCLKLTHLFNGSGFPCTWNQIAWFERNMAQESGLWHLLRNSQMPRTLLAPEYLTSLRITQHWFAVNKDLWLSLLRLFCSSVLGKYKDLKKCLLETRVHKGEGGKAVTRCDLLLFARHEWFQRNCNSVSYLAQWLGGSSLFATDGQAAIHFQCATETTQNWQIMPVKTDPVGCFLAPEKQSSLPSVKMDSLCFILAFMQCS